ncbi:hypothetical protein IAI10_16240 [Clostridium sp. 19966]|uniref:CD3337/EF1877 family mobilome membrane protein n=1 Tax=Clostridium sp. 19966 TaxID=2768166 RepID=UPI0028DF5264|nr:TcpD family membrane protein [Clostridium sp. 19966]MDT8718217.1 hypothetical protein [Clostridium sp. 19966]
MKKKNRVILVTIILTIFMSLISGGISAKAADNPENAMFPSAQELFNGQDKDKYLNEYRPNYYLDLKKSGGIFKAFDFSILNTLANAIFSLESVLAYAVIVVVYYAFNLNIYDFFSSYLNAISNALKTTVFDQLSMAAISLAGIFFVIKLLKDQRTQIWTGLIEVILVATLGYGFLTNPTQVLNTVDKFNREISQNILEGTYFATNNGASSSSSTMAVCNNLWVIFVHKPWEVMEFGNTKIASQYEDKILTMDPSSDDRQNYVNDIAKDGQHFQSSVGKGRFVVSIVYLLIFIIMAIVIVLLCFFMLAFQIFSVLISLFAAIIFLLALIPWFGFKIINSWAGKIIGYMSMRISISFLLAVVFSFILATYEMSDKYSIFVIMLLQIVIIVAAYWKREDIFNMVLNFSKNSKEAFREPSNIHRHVRNDNLLSSQIRRNNKDRNSNIGSNIRSSTNASPQGGASSYQNRNNTSKGANNTTASNKTASSSSGNNTGTSSTGSNINNQNQGKSQQQSNPSNYKSNQAQRNNIEKHLQNINTAINEGNKDRKDDKINDNLNNIRKDTSNIKENAHTPNNDFAYEENPYASQRHYNNANLNDRLRLAEDILNNRYEASKYMSEKKAAKENTEPKYSYFVQKAMSREEMNLPRFEERQKIAVAAQIDKVYKSGGDVNQLYIMSDEQNNDVERPKAVVAEENNNEGHVEPKEIETNLNNTGPETLINDFNNEFNKKYDVKFMENLIKKYGKENVRQVLNEMKRINKKDSIKNPAGYITTSLRNNKIERNED